MPIHPPTAPQKRHHLPRVEQALLEVGQVPREAVHVLVEAVEGAVQQALEALPAEDHEQGVLQPLVSHERREDHANLSAR